MSTPSTLTEFDTAELHALNLEQLLEVLKGHDERVPRAVIDECARRGDEMVKALAGLVVDDAFWGEDASSGDWWLRLHSVMILGLIPGARAGHLLVNCMRRMSETNDEYLQDWLAGYWPVLFHNKPDAVMPDLRALCVDQDLDWYIRVNALDPIVAAAEAQGPEALEDALEWLADRVKNESDEWEFRLRAAGTLLDFPRARYRPLLEQIATRQQRPIRDFTIEEVNAAYAAGRDNPEWLRFKDPWKFYSPEAIAGRQKRWAKEDAEEIAGLSDDDDLLLSLQTPFTRPVPKTGRNDPCGSGKKYKKCCLTRDEA